MAAEITIRENSMAEMAYVGETPWHGLGQQLPAGADLSVWREMAGLDWEIRRSPVISLMNGALKEVPKTDVLYRSDSSAPLSIVSRGYRVVQPEKVLGFFSDLVDSHGFVLDTAGTLMGGRRIWALARTGMSDEIVRGDTVKNYLLLATSCDGSIATTARFTTVRVVCNNTLQCSLASTSGKTVRVRHTVDFDPVLAKEDLGLYAESGFDTFIATMKKLSGIPMPNYRAEGILTQLFSGVHSEIPVTQTRGYRKIMALFNGEGRGSQMDGVEGTAWGLVNAVTEYADYHVKARSQDNRLASAWFGKNANLKDRVVELALAR